MTTVPAKKETAKEKQSNSLKLKLDDMAVIKPKTDKQMEFFEAYQRGDYFIALRVRYNLIFS